MGFIFRVRLSSFFAGAAVASVAGFYFLYKDHVLTQQNISQRVKVACESLDERIELLNQRVTELEKLNSAESPKAVESID
ncbi:hypothetical protein M5K25_016870 [Dendrobium thyrsiflorum]|uniref:Uncharacterized protein n=1 Tax=Dendrobium thyrsiflorum TaxID=117978 RepID=A0ABD0UL01_DENTH